MRKLIMNNEDTKTVLVFENGEDWSEMSDQYPPKIITLTKKGFEELLESQKEGGDPRPKDFQKLDFIYLPEDLPQILRSVRKELVDFVNVATDVLNCEDYYEDSPEPLEFIDQAMGRMMLMMKKLGKIDDPRGDLEKYGFVTLE